LGKAVNRGRQVVCSSWVAQGVERRRKGGGGGVKGGKGAAVGGARARGVASRQVRGLEKDRGGGGRCLWQPACLAVHCPPRAHFGSISALQPIWQLLPAVWAVHGIIRQYMCIEHEKKGRNEATVRNTGWTSRTSINPDIRGTKK
jgi:hypothetical protein